MRGRWGDTWQRAVAHKRVDELLPALALAGFSGIYIDRFGFADRAAELEQSLQRALGHAPTTSADGRLAFFNLTEYVAELRQQVPDTRWQALRQQVLTLHAVSFPPLTNERQPNAP